MGRRYNTQPTRPLVSGTTYSFAGGAFQPTPCSGSGETSLTSPRFALCASKRRIRTHKCSWLALRCRTPSRRHMMRWPRQCFKFQAITDQLGCVAVLILTPKMGYIMVHSLDSGPGEGSEQVTGEVVIPCPDKIARHMPDAVLGFRCKGSDQ